MRKSIFSALVITMALSVASMASAAELKIGIFGMQEVATKSEAFKEGDKKLQNTFSKEKAEIEKEQAALKKMAEDLNAPGGKLTPEQLEEKQLDYMRKKRAFDEKTGLFLRRVEQEERRIQQSIGALIVKAAQAYGQRNNYSLIMDAASAGVFHADPSLDLTGEILKETNKLWKENPVLTPPSKPAAKPGPDKLD